MTSALRRRARYVWRRLHGDRRPSVEAALEWLLSRENGRGITASSASAIGCPAVTEACVETLLALGCREEARRCEAWLATQPPGIASPLSPSAALARQIVRWYGEADRGRADRALRSLERRQRANGGFLADWHWFAPARLRVEDTWAAKYYLDAALLRVRAAFDDQWRRFPETIDPTDGRMEAVRTWFATLSPTAHVADVGCGKGRFLRHLRAWFPEARLTGIDLSAAMRACLPEGIAAREGSLLRIPAEDGEFDGALAVESLEHALVPGRAVAELCRVVRPGGRVLVIDKNHAKQPLSEHDPWERWFTPEELAAWLGRHCREVTVRPVSHLEGRAGHDLFLAAEGRR